MYMDANIFKALAAAAVKALLFLAVSSDEKQFWVFYLHFLMQIMKFIIPILLLLGVALQTGAQGLVTGKVMDAGNNTPVQYATVTVTDKASNKLVNGASTDSTGAFQLKKLPFGSYTLSVTFLGYKPLTLDNLVLSKATPQLRLGVLKLQANSQSLSGVTINGTPPVVENKIDKMVYNAANDVTAQGGVALDVLKKVPQVSVDADGNVELQGNSNIRFLINGKPSSIFGSSLTDALAAIPASQIQNIEVITSPGAKYDAQGTGGIINIVMKENKMKGVNGSITAAAGTRMENASVNLNMRNGNFGMNAFFSGNATLRSKGGNSQDRTSFNAPDSTYNHLVQDGYTYLKRHGYEAGLGFDWDLGKKDVLSAGFQYSDFSSTRNGITNQQEMTLDAGNQPLNGIYSQRTSTSHNAFHSFDWNLDYKHTFPNSGGDLEFLYTASYGTPALQSYQEQTYTGVATPFSGTSNANSGTDHQHNISLDYSKPFGEGVTLEAGAKATFQQINNITNVDVLNAGSGLYTKDPAQSYNLRYNMNVYAGYVSSSFSLFQKFLDVKAGLRVERTDVSISYQDTHIPSYTTFVPSVTFSHKLSEQAFVKLSYAHRIERPEYDELNPFLNISDPYNITTGNPLLQPEIGDNFELGYNRSFTNGGNLYVALTERINSHDIKPYTTFYPSFKVGDSIYNNVSVTNRVNIGEEYNTGLIVSGSMPISSSLDLRGNVMVFNRHVINRLDSSNTTNGLNWRANANLSYKLPQHLIIEAFGNYRSAFNSIQGRAPQFITYTLALKKQIGKSKLDIGLVATNFLKDNVRQVTTIQTPIYDAYSVREIPLRSFGISVNYRFGKLEFKKDKEHELKDFQGEN